MKYYHGSDSIIIDSSPTLHLALDRRRRLIAGNAPSPYWKSYDDGNQPDPTLTRPAPPLGITILPYLLKHALPGQDNAGTNTSNHVSSPVLRRSSLPLRPLTFQDALEATPSHPVTDLPFSQRHSMPSATLATMQPSHMSPPSFRSEDTTNEVESRSRLMTIIQTLRAHIDTMEAPPPYLPDGSGERASVGRPA